MTSPLTAQNRESEEYINYFNNGNYIKSLEIINKKLDEFYSTRVEDKRIPTGFITMKDVSKEVDLKMIFRNRKVEPFLIEDKPGISILHLYAARNYFKLTNYDYSLNHYIQCLRFKKVEEKKDDIIYYEIAQVFKKGNYFNAYVNFLETASSLNMDNYGYSLELGRALYRTKMKKRAIYHLERYLSGADEPFSPELYLMLGNLYEDIGKYLETEKYYIKYLEKKPDDGNIHFALGHIAFLRTGNYPLALSSLEKALALLPEKELFKKSKTYEYKADIALQELEFEKAVLFYTETIKYQQKIGDEIKIKKSEITGLHERIRTLKSNLLKVENFEQYEEYENLMDEKGKKEAELRQIENEYNKLNAGKVRWNIAYSLERLEKLNEAIAYYRDAIAFDFNSNQARKKIINLELKIKRGY
ncbi:MAG TPA: tetratricopeptide repeat protein [Spirochaetota bacterium]|nr:tetratricopeptide repeat protein [Spirochaetota bacterium]HPC39495.1 tetratricopeptide repeat protein [Spirochaetota bacterium]HPL16291.1 tetratricopeptide repeat protein [Spirochaetota bacterium]HQF06832.1 tetratricopeptide repeat protein [Spirochaetota bacterium]HQH95549.1 tetratricopeptide repeat protein [Spirochaetota bacterium]